MGNGKWGRLKRIITNDGRCLNGTAVATTRGTRATRCLGNLRTALPPQCPMPIAQ
ncbi:hypothetical protein [Tolypothrix sp. VBCCA 56010]|uniref:hypothetical protein n=1 Tax=Tolypothrix sp. VBCCA 56010 TaxID=3137731 RepID=UPI003D7E18EB